MIHYITHAPHYMDEEIISKTPNFFDDSIFVAGSSIGSRDWRNPVCRELGKIMHVFNPSRDSFSYKNPEEIEIKTEIQTEWEYYYLHKVKNVLFWFDDETLAPIALFELGAALERNNQNLYIGCHPDYKRRYDVQYQVSKFGHYIQYTIEDLIDSVETSVEIKYGKDYYS